MYNKCTKLTRCAGSPRNDVFARRRCTKTIKQLQIFKTVFEWKVKLTLMLKFQGMGTDLKS